ncbi:MAG: 5-formyltetrahydrofolate cyclo-ligase [Candidatus Omnitrophica bacterium]|nr:5-formyltetrahydrofolate cyclo-ligase [Candidatus Omnitrophota bacterium]
MKEELRNQGKIQRQSLSEKEWLEKSRLIQEKLVCEPLYQQAKVILCYVHTDREVRTDFIIQQALVSGKTVCLPQVRWQERQLIASRIYSLDEIDHQGVVPRGIRLRPINSQELDLVITPGVLFDVFGNRIGMGGGFFDRFFKEITTKTKKVALAFSFQVRETCLPVGQDDVPVDIIVTEEKVYYPGY